MIDRTAIARDFEAAPFHRWLGVKVLQAAEDGVEVEIPWREEFYAQVERTYMHGGIIASIIDFTADFAIAVKLGHALPTIDLRTDYHKAVPGGTVRARGGVIKAGRTIVTAEARIFDAAGALVASGRGAYLNRT